MGAGAAAGNGIVAGEFNGGGVWRYEDGTGWQQLTTADAGQVAVDAQGDVAAGAFGNGLWLYHATSNGAGTRLDRLPNAADTPPPRRDVAAGLPDQRPRSGARFSPARIFCFLLAGRPAFWQSGSRGEPQT